MARHYQGLKLEEGVNFQNSTAWHINKFVFVCVCVCEGEISYILRGKIYIAHKYKKKTKQTRTEKNKQAKLQLLAQGQNPYNLEVTISVSLYSLPYSCP